MPAAFVIMVGEGGTPVVRRYWAAFVKKVAVSAIFLGSSVAGKVFLWDTEPEDC